MPVVDPAAFQQPLPEPPKADLTDDATALLVAQADSRYPNLFTPESFAVLLNADILLDRLETDATAYKYPPEQVAFERQRIQSLLAQFLICEVHLLSDFPDVGIAHDAVALRNMEATLANDSGRSVASAAVQLGSSREIDYVDRFRVMRTNIVLFPKAVTPGGPELLQPTTQRLRLTLRSDSTEFAAWWDVTPTFMP